MTPRTATRLSFALLLGTLGLSSASFANRFLEDVSAASPLIPMQVFAERRARLLEQVKDGAIVLFGAPVRNRNSDVDYEYRQNSDFQYLTGFSEPGAVAVLKREGKQPQYVLIVRERNAGMETWTGLRAGSAGAKANYLADEAIGYGSGFGAEPRGIKEALGKVLKGERKIYLSDGGEANARTWLSEALGSDPNVESVRPFLHDMRRVKDRYEQALLRKAAHISSEAHQEAMRLCVPGLAEYQLQAVIEYVFKSSGAKRPGYPCIVGSGPNSCILHYQDCNRVLESGDMLVVDVGAEYGFYTADVTRSFPANGKFSEEQAVIYSLVLDAQKAAIAKAVPGGTIHAIQQAAQTVLKDGLKKLGLAKGNTHPQMLWIHGFCHWLGLDVHDECGGMDVPLEPGMVFTIEPGLYIPSGTDVDPKWWNIGVRIEDDVLITSEGCELLSIAPREIVEIEALMAEDSRFPLPNEATLPNKN